MSESIDERVRHLNEAMNRLELQISAETDILKEQYVKAAELMPKDKTFFLNGIQAGSVVKSYLFSHKGIEVPGESTISISEFIDSVIKFANYPKRKIEVLGDLVVHLKGIRVLIASQEIQ